jgi:hypothetical protein
MQATAIDAKNGRFFNRIQNRLGISGIVVNLSEVSEQGRNVAYFDLQFSQVSGEDGLISCRVEDPRIVTFMRRVHAGFSVEVGGMLCQDADGRFYVQTYYSQFVKNGNVFKGGSDVAKTADANTGR